MNLVSKFCEKVILIIDTHPTITTVSLFKQHQEKEADKEIEIARGRKSSSPVLKLILDNRDFQIKYHRHINKYYGAAISLVLNHPKFEDYPELIGKTVTVPIDLFNFDSIINSGYFDFGNYSGKTFSFDLYSSAFYMDCFRIVPDDTPAIVDRVSNYKRFWCGEKVSILQPGTVYLDRWGDLYLALSSKVWSNKFGSGWSSDGFGNYSFHKSWSMLKYSEKRPGTVMMYLGNDDRVLSEIVNIATDTPTFLSLINNLMSRFERVDTPEWITNTNIGRNFLRLKGYYNGHFVKQLEVPGYVDLYKSIGEWEGLRKIIFEAGDTIGITTFSEEGVADLEQFFQVSTDKDKDIVISELEKKIYRQYILNVLNHWINSLSTVTAYEAEKYQEIYKNKKAELTKDLINEFLDRKSIRSVEIKTSFQNWWSIDNFVKIGLFENEAEFIKEFTNIRNNNFDAKGC